VVLISRRSLSTPTFFDDVNLTPATHFCHLFFFHIYSSRSSPLSHLGGKCIPSPKINVLSPSQFQDVAIGYQLESSLEVDQICFLTSPFSPLQPLEFVFRFENIFFFRPFFSPPTQPPNLFPHPPIIRFFLFFAHHKVSLAMSPSLIDQEPPA